VERNEDGSPRADWRIAEVAKGQGGVISLAQLERCGLSRSAAARRARAGRLHRLHRGVYAVGHAAVGRHGRLWAAVLASDGVLTHRTAGDLHALRRSVSARIEVTAPVARRIDGVLVHRGVVPEITLIDGLPVTTVERTVLDLADVLRADQLDRVLDEADRRRILDVPTLTGLIGTSNGRRGVGVLRRALASFQPPPFTRSELEIRFLALVEDAGIPAPMVNQMLLGYEVDFHWPSERLVVETDGWGDHGTYAAFVRDSRREAALRIAGYEVLRLSWDQVVRRPGEVLRLIRASRALSR
jgi:hypothetical protein